MEIIDAVNNIGYAPSGNRQAIVVGDYKLSVQASKLHYCTPRKNLRNADDYSRMELAIISDFPIMKGLSAFPKLKELKELCDGDFEPDSTFSLFGYVPVALLNDLYLHFKENA